MVSFSYILHSNSYFIAKLTVLSYSVKNKQLMWDIFGDYSSYLLETTHFVQNITIGTAQIM